MAKKAKKRNGKAKVAVKPEQPKQGVPKAKEAHKAQAPDLDALRKPVLDANAGLTKAEAEVKALIDKGMGLIAQAKGEYREALGLYREACRKAEVDCEFEGGRSENVSPKPCSFLFCAHSRIDRQAIHKYGRCGRISGECCYAERLGG